MRRAAWISRASASTGSCSASATTVPSRTASDTAWFTTAPAFACSTVSWYSLDHDMPPNSTAAARSIRSIQSPSVARKTMTLPRSSVMTAGFGEMPAISIVTCGISGNARPMPSASTTGRPSLAAHTTGMTPFEPPISADISATTGRFHRVSTISRRRPPSSPLSIFSIETVGAPTPPHGMRRASSGSSSRSTSGTGPWSSTAWSDARSPISVSPPPPAPRIAHPRASAGSVEASSCMARMLLKRRRGRTPRVPRVR